MQTQSVLDYAPGMVAMLVGNNNYPPAEVAVEPVLEGAVKTQRPPAQDSESSESSYTLAPLLGAASHTEGLAQASLPSSTRRKISSKPPSSTLSSIPSPSPSLVPSPALRYPGPPVLSVLVLAPAPYPHWY